MARVSKADMGEKNPVEYQVGARRARKARKNVATQVKGLIEGADLTGSHPFVARRIRGYSDALQSGDPVATRSALMELAAAAGATAVALDLSMPKEAARRAA